MALDFFAGCVGGIAGVVVGYPLDTIKVHLQTQDPKNPKYRGTWNCFTTILKKESAFGLYKGMSSPLAGVALVNAITFGVYGNVQRALPGNPGNTNYTNIFLAGSAAGMAQSVICCPMELAKTRMQLQDTATQPERTTSPTTRTTGSGRLTGPLDCLKRVAIADGYRGVFRGYGVTLAREMSGFGLYFVCYEYLSANMCRWLRPPGGAESAEGDNELGAGGIMLAGGLSGVASWVLTYPLDVVKSRVQIDGCGPEGRRYRGALDCFARSYREEGLRTFTRGLNSTVIRAFPTNAATFLAVTMTFKLLAPLFESKTTSTSTAPQGGATVIINIKETSIGGVAATATSSGELHHHHHLQPSRLVLVQAANRDDIVFGAVAGNGAGAVPGSKRSDIGRMTVFAETLF